MVGTYSIGVNSTLKVGLVPMETSHDDTKIKNIGSQQLSLFIILPIDTGEK